MKTKFLFTLFLLGILCHQGNSQITPANLRQLQKKEDSLAAFARDMILDSLTAGRMRSDSQLVRTLVRSLQIKNSFFYPFDNVLGISKLYAPDSLFRIFSWTLSYDDYYSRQRGAIQLQTRDGSLRLIPLYDVSEISMDVMDSVRTKLNWIGAVYYDMVKTEYKGKPYYTLFGIDNNTVMSNKKWIEVLSFNERGEPQFGGPFFSFKEDSVKKPVQFRVQLEYKEDARILLRYDPEMQMIIYDHLVPEDGEPEKKWTYVPDGDYEGFKWQNGQWVHIEKIFNFKLQDGEAPLEKPILDNKGKTNESVLEQQSEKNKTKKPGGNR
ncbi:MAG: hypothetical protein GC171_16255 [Terrimonas sp.]|nr:hypothetical protein [Terrimonas sp.]